MSAVLWKCIKIHLYSLLKHRVVPCDLLCLELSKNSCEKPVILKNVEANNKVN